MKNINDDYELIPVEEEDDEEKSKESNQYDYELIPADETTEKEISETDEYNYELISADETTTTKPTTPTYTPPEEGLTYDQFKSNPQLLATAKRFAKNRLGFDNISDEDAVDEVIEHFREFKVNELTAGADWNYTSGLVTDGKRDEINDYKSLYRATEAMENFGGGVMSTIGDYAEGILTAPSTLVGLLLPGGGKLAGIAAQQTAKLGVGRIIAGAAARPITTAVGVETTAGVLQDVAAQKSLMAVDEQDDFDFGQTITTGVLTGAATAVVGSVPLFLAKKYGAKKISKMAQTDDLLAKSQKAVEEKTKKADTTAKETLSKAGTKGNEVKERLKELNKESVGAGKKVGKDIADDVGVDEPLRVAVTPDKLDRLSAAAVEVLGETGLKTFRTVDDKGKEVVKKERITEGIARVIRGAKDDATNKALADDFGKILNKYNLTQDDFANLFMSEFSEAGRLLQKAGNSRKQLKEMLKSIDDVSTSDIFSLNESALDVFAKSKKAMDKDDVQGFLKIFDHDWVDYFRSADALRLAAMTSQVGTTVRNTVGGFSRVGIDALATLFDNAVQGVVTGTRRIVTGEKGTQTFKDAFQDTFAIAYGLINKDKAIAVEQIFAMGFQNKAQKLYRQLADLEDLTGVGLKGKKPPSKMRNLTTGVGRNLNVLNTLSDNMFKRAAFMGGLERSLRLMKRRRLASGQKVNDADFDLLEIMKAGNFNKVFGTEQGKKALDRAIEEALYFTYQASPKSTVGQLLVKGANNLPFLTTSVVPFPRFLANAMRFTYEYSPAFLLSTRVRQELIRSFGKETGEEFGIRSYHNTAKGLAGLGVLFGAAAFRESEYAGEKWYEGKSEDGQTYDLRPFFPAAPYLFFADLIKRYRAKEEVVDKRTFRDSLQAITGMQVGKAGFGLYAMDKLVDDIGNIFDGSLESEEATLRVIAEFVSNITSTYFMPLTPFQDVYNTFIAGDDERIIRENQVEDMGALILHKSLARIPGNYNIEKMLHEMYGTEYNIPKAYQSPTREGIMRRPTSITRQIYGRLYKGKKTEIEKELDRLKITKAEVFRKTGITEADRLLGFYMGEFMTDIVAPFIKTDFYKRLPNEAKREALKLEIARVRKKVTDSVSRTVIEDGNNVKTKPYTKVKFKKLPKFYRNIAINTYNQVYGEPTKYKDYDYEILFDLAQQSRKKFKDKKFILEDIDDELKQRDPD